MLMPVRGQATTSSTARNKRASGAGRRKHSMPNATDPGKPGVDSRTRACGSEVSPILGLEDEAAFQRSLRAFVEVFHPANHAEFNEVKNMALAQWNHDRFQAIQNELLESAARNALPCSDLLRQVACGFQRSVDSSAAIARAGCLSRAAQAAYYAAQKALFMLQDRRTRRKLGANEAKKAVKRLTSTDKPCAA